MARRNDVAIAAALQAMAQVVGQQPNAGGNDGVRMLETFLRNHPPTFKGRSKVSHEMDPEHTSEVATHETHHANSKDVVVNPPDTLPSQFFLISDTDQYEEEKNTRRGRGVELC